MIQYLMAKIDEIKEILNTLRIAMSISFGMLAVLVGSVIKRYDAHLVDAVFWTGVFVSMVLIAFIAKIIKKISEKTKEIKDL